MSERLGKVRVATFLRRLGAHMERQAQAALRRYPPQTREMFALLDGHEEEYWPKAGEHACKPHKCRNRFAHGAYGGNKRSHWTHRWLFMGLTWRHGGEWITLPLRLDLLGQLDNSPHEQVEQFALLLRRLRLRPRALLLDRGYDSNRVRQVAAKYHLPIGQRIAFQRHGRSARRFTVEGGLEVTLNQSLEATAQDRTVRVDAWKDKRSGAWIAQRVRTVRGRLTLDGPLLDLTVVAALKPQQALAPRWVLDIEHSMVLAFPPGTGARDSHRIYRHRWNVEATFNLWSQDRPQARPKTIQAHVVLFCAYALRMCAGALLRLAAREMAIQGFLDVPPARITTRIASRWVLEPD